jgi:hypothetical protein
MTALSSQLVGREGDLGSFWCIVATGWYRYWTLSIVHIVLAALSV